MAPSLLLMLPSQGSNVSTSTITEHECYVYERNTSNDFGYPYSFQSEYDPQILSEEDRHNNDESSCTPEEQECDAPFLNLEADQGPILSSPETDDSKLEFPSVRRHSNSFCLGMSYDDYEQFDGINESTLMIEDDSHSDDFKAIDSHDTSSSSIPAEGEMQLLLPSSANDPNIDRINQAPPEGSNRANNDDEMSSITSTAQTDEKDEARDSRMERNSIPVCEETDSFYVGDCNDRGDDSIDNASKNKRVWSEPGTDSSPRVMNQSDNGMLDDRTVHDTKKNETKGVLECACRSGREDKKEDSDMDDQSDSTISASEKSDEMEHESESTLEESENNVSTDSSSPEEAAEGNNDSDHSQETKTSSASTSKRRRPHLPKISSAISLLSSSSSSSIDSLNDTEPLRDFKLLSIYSDPHQKELSSKDHCSPIPISDSDSSIESVQSFAFTPYYSNSKNTALSPTKNNQIKKDILSMNNMRYSLMHLDRQKQKDQHENIKASSKESPITSNSKTSKDPTYSVSPSKHS